MNPNSLQNAMTVMADIGDLEMTLAAFYELCGERFPDDKDFWLNIAHQEKLHADSIKELADLVSANPGEFEIGRTFNSIAIRNIKTYVLKSKEELKQGQLDRKTALFFARDIENSVIEANYKEFVKTNNMEFRNIIDEITTQTMAHKAQLAAKISALAGK